MVKIITYDGNGHIVIHYGKDKFICLYCDLFMPIKHWRIYLESR